MYYACIGAGACVIVGLVVSFATGYQRAEELDARLQSPVFYRLAFFLPERYRRWLKFGVRYNRIRADVDENSTGVRLLSTKSIESKSDLCG